jgi:predicted sugar kinase
MPFPDDENARAIAAAYHGALPAFKHHDMTALARALRTLHSVGLKSKELELQSDNTRAWLEGCWEREIPAGLSSFGPIVYVIGKEGSAHLEDVNTLAQTHRLEHFRLVCDQLRGCYFYLAIIARA